MTASQHACVRLHSICRNTQTTSAHCPKQSTHPPTAPAQNPGAPLCPPHQLRSAHTATSQPDTPDKPFTLLLWLCCCCCQLQIPSGGLVQGGQLICCCCCCRCCCCCHCCCCFCRQEAVLIHESTACWSRCQLQLKRQRHGQQAERRCRVPGCLNRVMNMTDINQSISTVSSPCPDRLVDSTAASTHGHKVTK